MPQTVQAVWICGCPCLWVPDSFQHLRNIFKSLGVAQWHCLEHWVVICLPEDPLRMCLAPLCPFPGRQEKAGTGGVPGKGAERGLPLPVLPSGKCNRLGGKLRIWVVACVYGVAAC